MKTTAKWKSALAFDVMSDNHHSFQLDTTKDSGSLDSGMSPKQALLGALCTCSGMDVVGILEKMKVSFSVLEIEAETEQTETHPKVFKWIKMKYKSNIAKEDIDKLTKAIELSQEKYCGISIMLKKHCAVTYTIELV